MELYINEYLAIPNSEMLEQCHIELPSPPAPLPILGEPQFIGC